MNCEIAVPVLIILATLTKVVTVMHIPCDGCRVSLLVHSGPRGPGVVDLQLSLLDSGSGTLTKDNVTALTLGQFITYLSSRQRLPHLYIYSSALSLSPLYEASLRAFSLSNQRDKGEDKA